jgi:hypothetical protein
MNWFFFKLIAPRADFATTMTEDEHSLMQTHGLFWKKLVDEGTAVVVGPVLDPKGPFGMAVARLLDEKAARALTLTDPVITAGKGFKYEIYPMLRALTRDSVR